MNEYFKTVTLGAFTWKNAERIGLLMEYIKKTSPAWLALHFLLVTLCLNFPVMLSIARLEPYELFSRLYGSETVHSLPESIREALAESSSIDTENASNFNRLMIESGYGPRLVMPLLGMAFGLVLIIQIVFYLCAAVFAGISRLNVAPLSLRDRLGLALYSSTLPVLAASLFGLFLPTVHIMIFYFLVIFFIFQRSKLCPNG